MHTWYAQQNKIHRIAVRGRMGDFSVHDSTNERYRTMMEEWHRKNRFASPEERRRSLHAFVDFFNHERVHGTLGMTPVEKLAQYAKRMESGDNAV